MSAWTEFRDDVVESLKFDKVTEQMKQDFIKWLVETCLPLAETAAANFISQIKEQARTETGWCKVRDLIVLPLAINGLIYVVEMVLTKTMEKTA